MFELHSTHDESITSIKKGRALLSLTHRDTHFVKAYFVAASPDQMRNGDALSDANVRTVHVRVYCLARSYDCLTFDRRHIVLAAAKPCACDHPAVLRRRGARER